MVFHNKVATVFGGTGFVGRQVVRELAALGMRVKIASRIPESANSLKPCGAVGQVVPVLCNYKDASSVRSAIHGSDYVVNCIGVLYERGKRAKFQFLHTDLPALIAKSCADENVTRFVHVSALGCEQSKSKYAKTKYAGEQAVLSNFPKAIILRPSIIFGPDDNFFNMFAQLARFVPVLPLIGGGKTKFQPVYVGDVADAIVEGLTHDGKKYVGRTFQLGGPDVVSFEEVYEIIEKYTGRKRCKVTLPFCVAKLEARFLSLLPKPLLTVDQVESLKTDNVVSLDSKGFEQFGITPKAMDVILPEYLGYYKAGGRFVIA